MNESIDEEEARKAVKLAKIMNGVAYLLFVIYVLIILYLIFTLGKNTILIIATSIILSIILFFPPFYILNRKIDKLLGIQESYFKTRKDWIKKNFLKIMGLFIPIISGAMKKSKSSEETISIFEQLLQESKEELRMKYERFKKNMPPIKQKATDEVVNIFLNDKILEGSNELEGILDSVIKLMKLYLQLFLIFFILIIILDIPSFMMLVPYISFLCMFAIFFFSKYAKPFRILELFRNLKIKIKWKPLAGVKWEIMETFLIGFTSLVLYIMYKKTTDPVFSIILSFAVLFFFSGFTIPEIAKIIIIGYIFLKRKISKYFI